MSLKSSSLAEKQALQSGSAPASEKVQKDGEIVQGTKLLFCHVSNHHRLKPPVRRAKPRISETAVSC
jgi:hypothetical protein